MLRNYNYVVTILLYPFLFLVSYLILNNSLKGDFYLYLVIAMIIILIPSFIMSLYNASEEILNSKSKWRLILLILFSYFYLPIYYTKYVVNSEKYLGYIILILSGVVSFFTFDAFNKRIYNFITEAYKNSVVINDNFVYTSVDKLFTINISKDFRCNQNDIGDYVIYCDKLDDDSFIGVYSYDVTDYDEDEISNILDFHLNQTEEYIKEKKYESELNKTNDIITMDYDKMVVLLTQKNYVTENGNYSLVIIKEMPKEFEDILEFQKMIETIYFLNYNEEVSS